MPSPSNGVVPKPPTMVPSSMTVTLLPAIFSPSLPARNDAPRYTESPLTPSKMCSSIEVATIGSRTTGTCAVFALRAPRRRSVRRAASLPTCSGGLEFGQTARHRVPIVALHATLLVLRDGNSGHGTIGTPVLADEAVRVGEHFAAGGSVERSTFGVLHARIGIERGFLGAAGVVDPLRAGE